MDSVFNNGQTKIIIRFVIRMCVFFTHLISRSNPITLQEIRTNRTGGLTSTEYSTGFDMFSTIHDMTQKQTILKAIDSDFRSVRVGGKSATGSILKCGYKFIQTCCGMSSYWRVPLFHVATCYTICFGMVLRGSTGERQVPNFVNPLIDWLLC